MTDEHELPPELAELERSLLASRLEPDGSLKTRTLSRVQRELALSRRRDLWGYLSGVAAVAFLALNISLAAARTDALPAPGPERKDVLAAYRQIRESVPELSAEEAARQSILLAGASNLRLYAEPRGSLPR